MVISIRTAAVGGFLALLVLQPQVARSGAWTRPAGEGQAIVSLSHGTGPGGAVLDGVPDRELETTQLYVEYGLTDGLTLGGKAYAQISLDEPRDSSALVGGFLRHRVWQDSWEGHGAIASVEAGYSHPADDLVGADFTEDAPGAAPEAYGSALYGHSWWGDWGSAFLSTGVSYYWRGEGEADNLRAEATAGYAPEPWVMGMLSLYGLEPLGDGTDRSLKIAPSVAFTMAPFGKGDGDEAAQRRRKLTLQLGASYDVLNPGDGVGVSISIWHPF